ncbi:MAG TPA: hypothetical protein VHV77_06935 [Pirellulales bacterium]|nr:hypothetical protein [Pirellulales bacterium]
MTSASDASNPPPHEPVEQSEYVLGDEIVEPEAISARDQAARRLAQAVERLEAEAHPNREPFQISLRDMLQMFIGVSILLGMGRLLPRGAFAGICGVAVLVCRLFLDTFVSPHSTRAELAWWTLMATYLLSIVGAMITE